MPFICVVGVSGGRAIEQKEGIFMQCVHLTHDGTMCMTITFPSSEVVHKLFFRVWGVCWKGDSLKPPSSSCISIRWIHAVVFTCGASKKMSAEMACVAALSFRAPGLMLAFVVGCAFVCDLTTPPYAMMWPGDMPIGPMPPSICAREHTFDAETEDTTAEQGLFS